MSVSSRHHAWTTKIPRYLRIAAYLACALIAVSLILLLLHRGLLPILAWFLPQLEVPFYDWAAYGAYRTQELVTLDIPAPQASLVRWDEGAGCDDGGYVLLGLQGKSVAKPGPVILDSRGGLVWASDEYGVIMNLQMQRFEGVEYLTFWAGDKRGSMGWGAYFMLDSHYNVAYKIHAGGDDGLEGDLHEFQITDEGTALITVYNVTKADLRPMGWFRSADGWIVDSMFQEIDIKTGEMLFQWRASDHFRPEQSFYASAFAGYTEHIPYDFAHVNSIEKDEYGNYLISARHLHTISYINGTSGDLLWTLGGGYEDFADLSGGLASDFKWQHHARWISREEGILSVFDNGVAGPLHTDAPYSKGTILQLDLDNRTATHLHSFKSFGGTRAASQGSVQLLPQNQHIFVGWGSSGAFSEYKMDGTLVCETHVSASITFWWERVKSYRAYKVHGWTGRPEYPPSAHISGDGIFVSWNGATEVAFWELQAQSGGGDDVFEEDEDDEEEDIYESIDVIEKRSFEEAFVLPSEGEYVRYRVLALDSDKRPLRASEPVEVQLDEGASVFALFMGISAGVLSAVGAWFVLKKWARRQRGGMVFSWDASKRKMIPYFDGYRYSKLST